MLQLTENQQLNDYTTLALTTAPTFNTVQTDGVVQMTITAVDVGAYLSSLVSTGKPVIMTNGAIKVAVTGNINGCVVNGQLVQTVTFVTFGLGFSSMILIATTLIFRPRLQWLFDCDRRFFQLPRGRERSLFSVWVAT